MIVFDLNRNDADALLRHAKEFTPQSGDAREDARLCNALLELRDALVSPLEEPDFSPVSKSDRQHRSSFQSVENILSAALHDWHR